MPAFLANVLEPRFGRAARVGAVDDLAPGLRRARFEGVALRGVGLRAGQEVEFRVSDRAFRHYTLSAADPVAGSFEVLFHLHGHGPGSTWAAELEPGQRVNVLGPGGALRLVSGATTHVLLGDATSLGAFLAIERSAPGRVFGAVEVDAGAERWAALAGSDLVAVPRASSGQRGNALRRWMETLPLQPDPRTGFYLVGHAQTITMLRSLLHRRGWPRSALRTKAYWADGKRGL